MRRRGFNPAHITQIDTPPHAKYDDVFEIIFARCGLGYGSIFALAGKRGTGKTQLATNIAGALLLPNPRDASRRDELTWPLYTTAKAYFREIKESWSPTEDGRHHATESDVLERFTLPCLLVIDEAHVRSESKWEDDQLAELVDRRCYRGKDTLILSNLDRKTLSAALGPSIVSRIHERGSFVEFDWPSFREVNGGR